MCGLAGYWMPGAGKVDATPMAEALSHRGPDDGGAWSDPACGVALSHRRLAIIDLSTAGHQPMLSPSGRFVAVFNGEIYNHLDLRGELEASGPIAWRGQSDTETLICGVERWGLPATLARCIGMFALAIWDRREQTLSLARDRMGEKPLFYGWSGGGGIVFGSELKALRAAPGFANAVDPASVALFLRFNYVPAPFSILRNIYKVEPGAIVILDERAPAARSDAPPTVATNGRVTGVSCRRYWSLEAVVASGADEAMTEAEAVDAMERRLMEAVELQMVADVPVGAFLSGGVDSSAVVALMRNVTGAEVKTFTIGFDQTGYDEAPHARAVARHLGTDHHELYVSPADALAVIAELPRIYDEPFADSSQIPTVLLSRMTRRNVTVALSGDAGDEVFGGYNRYLVSRRWWDAAARLPGPVRAGISRTITAISPGAWDRIARMPLIPTIPMLGNKAHKVAQILATSVSTHDVYRAASEEWNGCPPSSTLTHAASVDGGAQLRRTPEEQMMHWDSISYLPDDILVKVDRAAMAASLETRVPFLDHRVVEQSWRTPLRFKIRAGQGKWLLRQILYRYVPCELIERPKAGFAVPVGAWLRGALRPWAEDLLSPSSLSCTPSIDPDGIRLRWAQHLAGTHDWTSALWGVLMFQAWAAEWNRTTPDGSDRTTPVQTRAA